MTSNFYCGNAAAQTDPAYQMYCGNPQDTVSLTLDSIGAILGNIEFVSAAFAPITTATDEIKTYSGSLKV